MGAWASPFVACAGMDVDAGSDIVEPGFGRGVCGGAMEK